MKKFALSVFFVLVFVSCAQNSNFLAFESMNTFMTLKTYGKNSTKANLKIKSRILELENLFFLHSLG